MKSTSDLFIVDNSDADWTVRSYLKDWCELSRAIDIATGYFEIGALLALEEKWQSVERFRILMGDEVSLRTKRAFAQGLQKIGERLDNSLETEKAQNDFLQGVPAIVEAIRGGKIQCRVYRKDKFHAKAYLTHGRAAVIGSFGLVGSSNFTYPGLTDNVELNVQIRGPEVGLLQEWYERYWAEAEDVTPDDNSVPKKPTYKDGAVWINPSQRFEGVPEAVWNFHVGGYQVCEKWLKDRKGRTLSAEDIAHYQRVVVALNETIRLMAEIDRVIEAHGGWPGAFQSGSAGAAAQ